MVKEKIRRRKKIKVADIVIAVSLGALCITILYPFLNFVALSFNDGYDTLYGGIYLWPRVFTLDNYKQAFAHPKIVSSFLISVSRVLAQLAISLPLTALMAYALTEKRLPGRRLLNFFFFFTSIFSGGLVPSYILYRQLNILNSFWVLILPGIFSFYNAIVMRTFFEEIPISLRESAKIDGASELKIFFRVILPLSKPVLATIALFIGVGTWNDWFSGEFFINFKPDLTPASTLLYQIISEATFKVNVMQSGSGIIAAGQDSMNSISGTTPESLRMAFVIIIVFPIVCVYPFLQRYFVKGVMVGSVKE